MNKDNHLSYFSSRQTNIAKLLNYGTETSNPFIRKVHGKLVHVKGRMRKAIRKELVAQKALKSSHDNNVNSGIYGDSIKGIRKEYAKYVNNYTPPSPLQTIRLTNRDTVVRAIRKKSLVDRWNTLEYLATPERKDKVTNIINTKVRPMIRTRQVRVKGSPYVNLLQYKTKRGYET